MPHGFKLHIEEEHNPDHYMFFFMHLLEKPETEHTGQESYVSKLYKQGKYLFFPLGECFRDSVVTHSAE